MNYFAYFDIYFGIALFAWDVLAILQVGLGMHHPPFTHTLCIS